MKNIKIIPNMIDVRGGLGNLIKSENGENMLINFSNSLNQINKRY